MKIIRGVRSLVLAGVAAGLLGGAVMACGSPMRHGPAAATGSASPAAATAGFAGYRWTVVTIGHDGKTIPIPASYRVYLQFTPNGQFGANEPVNFHSGRYEATPGGFTISELTSTAVGWSGSDPVVLLSINAISAFGVGARALTRTSGDTLTINVNGYTLTAQRDGTQANWPLPRGT